MCVPCGIHSLFAVAVSLLLLFLLSLLLFCAKRRGVFDLCGLGRRRRRVPWYDAIAIRVSCRHLWLNDNQLSGSIPSTLGSLAALT
jgi:hypothetical protein